MPPDLYVHAVRQQRTPAKKRKRPATVSDLSHHSNPDDQCSTHPAHGDEEDAEEETVEEAAGDPFDAARMKSKGSKK
jgi:hypothetical protein